MPPAKTIMIDDMEVTLTPVKPLSGGGARVDIETDDRKWRVDISGTGTQTEIVTTWRDETLADLEEPDWLDDALTQIRQVA